MTAALPAPAQPADTKRASADQASAVAVAAAAGGDNLRSLKHSVNVKRAREAQPLRA